MRKTVSLATPRTEDFILRQTLEAESYGKGVQVKLIRSLNNAEKEVTKRLGRPTTDFTKRYLTQAQAELAGLTGALNEHFKGVLGQSRVTILQKHYNEAMRFIVRMQGYKLAQTPYKLPLKAVKAILAEPLGSKTYSLEDWVDKSLGNLKVRMKKELTTSVALSETMAQAARRIRTCFAISRRGSDIIARTAIMGASNRARDEVYEKKKEFIIGYRLVATLDSSTCVNCASLDGDEASKREYLGYPPFHMSCRCTVIPLTKIDEILPPRERAAVQAEEKRIVKHRDGTKSTVRKIISTKPVPASRTFEQFLQNQPAKWQKEWLGPGRYKLWKDGHLRLKDMAKNNRILKLDELKPKPPPIPPTAPPKPSPPKPPPPVKPPEAEKPPVTTPAPKPTKATAEPEKVRQKALDGTSFDPSKTKAWSKDARWDPGHAAFEPAPEKWTEQEISRRFGLWQIGGKHELSKARRAQIVQEIGDEMDYLSKRYPQMTSILNNRPISYTDFERNLWYRGTKASGLYTPGNPANLQFEAGLRSKVDEIPQIGKYVTGKGFQNTFRHELGHHIDYSKANLDILFSQKGVPRLDFGEMQDRKFWGNFYRKLVYGSEAVPTSFEARRAQKKVVKIVKQSLSEYGATDPGEMFAEAFAAFTSPQYRFAKKKLLPEVKAWLRLFLGPENTGAKHRGLVKLMEKKVVEAKTNLKSIIAGVEKKISRNETIMNWQRNAFKRAIAVLEQAGEDTSQYVFPKVIPGGKPTQIVSGIKMEKVA